MWQTQLSMVANPIGEIESRRRGAGRRARITASHRLATQTPCSAAAQSCKRRTTQSLHRARPPPRPAPPPAFLSSTPPPRARVGAKRKTPVVRICAGCRAETRVARPLAARPHSSLRTHRQPRARSLTIALPEATRRLLALRRQERASSRGPGAAIDCRSFVGTAGTILGNGQRVGHPRRIERAEAPRGAGGSSAVARPGTMRTLPHSLAGQRRRCAGSAPHRCGPVEVLSGVLPRGCRGLGEQPLRAGARRRRAAPCEAGCYPRCRWAPGAYHAEAARERHIDQS